MTSTVWNLAVAVEGQTRSFISGSTHTFGMSGMMCNSAVFLISVFLEQLSG